MKLRNLLSAITRPLTVARQELSAAGASKRASSEETKAQEKAAGDKRFHDLMKGRINRSDKLWVANRRYENAMEAAPTARAAKAAAFERDLAIARAKRVPQNPGSGSPIPAEKPKAVALYRVIEHADRKEVIQTLGNKAAPASRKAADRTDILWDDSVYLAGAFPESIDRAATIKPGENFRVMYDRATYDGKAIKHVDLMSYITRNGEAPPLDEKYFSTPLMGIRSPDGARSLDVTIKPENQGQTVYYGFRLTLDDGSIAYDRGAADATGRPSYYSAHIESQPKS